MITLIICLIAFYIFLKHDGLLSLLVLFAICALPVLAWIGVRL